MADVSSALNMAAISLEMSSVVAAAVALPDAHGFRTWSIRAASAFNRFLRTTFGPLALVAFGAWVLAIAVWSLLGITPWMSAPETIIPGVDNDLATRALDEWGGSTVAGDVALYSFVVAFFGMLWRDGIVRLLGEESLVDLIGSVTVAVGLVATLISIGIVGDLTAGTIAALIAFGVLAPLWLVPPILRRLEEATEDGIRRTMAVLGVVFGGGVLLQLIAASLP